MKNQYLKLAQMFLFLGVLTTSSGFAQSSSQITDPGNQTPIEEAEERVIVNTENIQTAVLSVPSTGTAWTVTLNEQPVEYQKVAVKAVNVTIFIEAEVGFSRLEAFRISQGLKSLKNNKSISRIEVCLIGGNKNLSKLRFDEKWQVTVSEDFETAGRYFWNKPESNKALLIVSKKAAGYVSDLDILKRLEGLNKDQSALIYYMTPKGVVSAKKTAPVAWCNLYWQDIWRATEEQFIEKQFDVFNEMLAGYYIVYCDLPETENPSNTLKITGIEKASGKQVANQMKTVKKGE